MPRHHYTSLRGSPDLNRETLSGTGSLESKAFIAPQTKPEVFKTGGVPGCPTAAKYCSWILVCFLKVAFFMMKKSIKICAPALGVPTKRFKTAKFLNPDILSDISVSG